MKLFRNFLILTRFQWMNEAIIDLTNLITDESMLFISIFMFSKPSISNVNPSISCLCFILKFISSFLVGFYELWLTTCKELFWDILKRHSQDLYLFSISFLLKAVSERIEISSSRPFFGYNLRNFTCVTWCECSF